MEKIEYEKNLVMSHNKVLTLITGVFFPILLVVLIF